jgi:tetratricopeptide (TPR) repeat protein/tRNA A-37 threonylcarbamoyl transferase component Bud32
LDEGTVVAFLEGGLSADDQTLVESHLDLCDACSELMTWAAADQVDRSRAPEPRPFIGQLAPGSHIDRYQILGAVGRGGMGEVYAAYHPDLDRRIALKVMHDSADGANERRARLLREARAIARLSHPNVITVHDAGTFEDRVYIAMEFVEGDTIDVWLRAQPRTWREILDVFIAAARGLAAAHAAGVIHRDFKPQNVMIGRDGSVRVMDFGLARLEDEPNTYEPGLELKRPAPASTVTKSGRVVGTPGYIAPEQFRHEPLDGRADQFSFCVALHEALYGRRPASGLPGRSARPDADVDGAKSSQAASVPSWLRAVIARGLAEERALRFASMDALIRALVKGRTRPRRRNIGIGIGLAIALLGLGGWRAARGNRISCEVPTARLADIWSGHDDAHRQAIHRAFAATGRPTAETSWQRFSRFLDDYVHAWSAMYVDSCEATHVRGEQSGEVHDLRMECLNDQLDRVRALTTVLTGADGATVGHAVTAANDLTAVSRCADIPLLRSAVALPRDQRTLETVHTLRGKLREAEALRDAANFRDAWERAMALRPQVEATEYGPLVAELLELLGCAAGVRDDVVFSEATLQKALFTAEAARDDVTAALAAVDLIYVEGFLLNRPREARMWWNLAESLLRRLGPGHDRVRAWALTNLGSVLLMNGDLETAERLLREAVVLKEAALGDAHPDLAISLATLSSILEEAGRPEEALRIADQAIAICNSNGDPDSDFYAMLQSVRGEALVALGRGAEAEAAFSISLRIARAYPKEMERLLSGPLQGLGNARLLQGSAASAVPVLEEALRIREGHSPNDNILAETQFSLARALWDAGGDRKRSLRLARQALKTFGSHQFPRRERAIVQWLADRDPSARHGRGQARQIDDLSKRASGRPMM